MNALQTRYDHFSILAFPCNQFGMQEPGADGKEIYNGVKYVRPGNGFEPIFQFFARIQVNGELEHPIYTFLKSFCPPVDPYFAKRERLFYEPLRDNDVRWNFEKFLVSPKGQVVARYSGDVPIKDIERDLVLLLDDDGSNQLHLA